MEASLVLKCPECGSDKNFKDGTRPLSNGETAQRYLCRDCGLRYSGAYYNRLNNVKDNSTSNQIGARAKNLAFAQKTKFCAEDAKLNADTKGLLVQFAAYMEREAYSVESDYVDKVKHLALLGANLRDPEHVKTVIGQMTYKDRKTGEIKKLKNGTKLFYCYAYTAFLNMLKMKWDMPKYTQEEFEPHVPYESELDALINAAKSRMLAAFLQTLKETFGDPSEVLRIKWADIDYEKKTITLRYPVKNHNIRTLKVSSRLLAMLDALPKKAERVFPKNYNAMLAAFVRMRKRTAEIHQNPRLLSVDFTAFRTWAGTNIAYHTNGNVLKVKQLLGHKAIKSTMRYIGKIDFQETDFETTSATTVEEILKLGAEGWVEYSKVVINGVEYHCFRKPKRFSQYQGSA